MSGIKSDVPSEANNRTHLTPASLPENVGSMATAMLVNSVEAMKADIAKVGGSLTAQKHDLLQRIEAIRTEATAIRQAEGELNTKGKEFTVAAGKLMTDPELFASVRKSILTKMANEDGQPLSLEERKARVDLVRQLRELSKARGERIPNHPSSRENKMRAMATPLEREEAQLIVTVVDAEKKLAAFQKQHGTGKPATIESLKAVTKSVTNKRQQANSKDVASTNGKPIGKSNGQRPPTMAGHKGVKSAKPALPLTKRNGTNGNGNGIRQSRKHTY